MFSKPNLVAGKLHTWDQFKSVLPEHALQLIYEHIDAESRKMCDWYWRSIKAKRRTSLIARSGSFVLLLLGTSLPIFAALRQDAVDKLLFTQWGVALLAIAGLFQVADKVFGWSSGWVRYITTVTTMENLIRVFHSEWGKYFSQKTGPFANSDVKLLYDLASALELELSKLQADETAKWVVEFNSGNSLLESLIKAQREETQGKLEALRTNLATQDVAAKAEVKAEEKAKIPGALEVKLIHKAVPVKVAIAVDDGLASDFTGYAWSKVGIAPGQHILRIKTYTDVSATIEKVFEIQAQAISRVEVNIDSGKT